MVKRLSLILASVAMLGVAIPSMAGATEATLGGARAPIGTPITGTGEDVILQSSLLGKITCSTLNLNGAITVNNGTTVEGSGKNTAPTQSGCVNGVKSVNVTNVEITKLFSNTTGTATVSFTSQVDVGTELKCTFTGTNVAGTIPTGNDILIFSAAAGVTGSPAACGTAKLSGEFTLEQTGTGTALILD